MKLRFIAPDCHYSLRKRNNLEICTDDVSAEFAGRYLLSKIKAAGSNFSEKAASELLRRLVGNSMLSQETVTKFHSRHIGILKTLRKSGLSVEQILELIEKTVFIDALPDSSFKNMKSHIAFNKDIPLPQILIHTQEIEDLDGKGFSAEHVGAQPFANINFAPAPAPGAGRKKKACWNVLLNGSCSSQNCQFSHVFRYHGYHV